MSSRDDDALFDVSIEDRSRMRSSHRDPLLMLRPLACDRPHVLRPIRGRHCAIESSRDSGMRIVSEFRRSRARSWLKALCRRQRELPTAALCTPRSVRRKTRRFALCGADAPADYIRSGSIGFVKVMRARTIIRRSLSRRSLASCGP